MFELRELLWICFNFSEFLSDVDSQPTEHQTSASNTHNTSLTTRSLSSSSLARCNDIIERIAPYYKYHGINIKTNYSDFDLHNIGLVTESQVGLANQ